MYAVYNVNVILWNGWMCTGCAALGSFTFAQIHVSVCLSLMGFSFQYVYNDRTLLCGYALGPRYGGNICCSIGPPLSDVRLSGWSRDVFAATDGGARAGHEVVSQSCLGRSSERMY